MRHAVDGGAARAVRLADFSRARSRPCGIASSASRSACGASARDAPPRRARRATGARPRSSASSHAMIAARTTPPPMPLQRFGRQAGTRRRRAAVASTRRRGRRRARPGSGRRASSARRRAPSSRGRSGCRVPGTVPKKGRWSAETSIGPPHERSTRAAASPGRSRRRPRSARAADACVLREAVVHPAAEPDRAGAAPHQHAAVVRRPEVVDEHPAHRRLPGRPVQPISRRSSGTGSVSTTYEPKFVTCRRTGPQPDVAAFVATTTASARTLPSRVETRPSATFDARVLVQRTPASSTASRSARTSRAGCTVAHSGKKTPRRKTGDRRASRLVPVERDGLLGRTGFVGGADRLVDRTILRGARRDHEQASLAQPDVVGQRPHGGDDRARPRARAPPRRRRRAPSAGRRGSPSSRG